MLRVDTARSREFDGIVVDDASEAAYASIQPIKACLAARTFQVLVFIALTRPTQALEGATARPVASLTSRMFEEGGSCSRMPSGEVYAFQPRATAGQQQYSKSTSSKSPTRRKDTTDHGRPSRTTMGAPRSTRWPRVERGATWTVFRSLRALLISTSLREIYDPGAGRLLVAGERFA